MFNSRGMNKEMRYICTVEFFSAINGNGVRSFERKWVQLDIAELRNMNLCFLSGVDPI